MNKTLYDLQVGDEVIVIGRNSKTIQKVTRLSANFVTIGRNKYRKIDGYIIGVDRWIRNYITVATPEDVERIKQQDRLDKLVKEVSSISFGSLSIEQLEAIIHIARQ